MLFALELYEELYEDQDYEDEHKKEGREEEYSYEETRAMRKRNSNRKGKNVMMMMIPNMK